jgi:hypothetical protein
MDQPPRQDVIVLGAGAAGTAAAIASAKTGAKTLLIDSGPLVGGELISGMPVDGAVNARGQWIVGGPARELFDECARLGGYIGAINDWRLIQYVAFDPEIMKVAAVNVLRRHNVELLLYTFVHGVEAKEGKVSALRAVNKTGHVKLDAKIFLDCSGDGDLAVMAGADCLTDGQAGEFQPLSMMFRMSGVETRPLLQFVCDHPEHFALGESDTMRGRRTDAQIAQELYNQNQPAVFFKGDGPLLSAAIARGQMYPTALIMIQPTSAARKEVCLNTTRVANIDATQTLQLSRQLGPLMDQALICARFMQKNVPGFAGAQFAALAPRMGIRETRRIAGESILTGDDVLQGVKHPDGVAKGCHHVDIHQSGTGQIRIPVANGGSYDIPWGCLIPQKLANTLIAGRCFSSDRRANGSARVMGPCMAMGHAIGTAAALCVQNGFSDSRQLPLTTLRTALQSQGTILDGTE